MMNMIPPPKPGKLENLTAFQVKLADLVAWVDYYRGETNRYAKTMDSAPQDPLVPDVQRLYTDTTFSRVAGMPLFDLTFLWLQFCRLYDLYRYVLTEHEEWPRHKAGVVFADLVPQQKMFVAMLVWKASKILSTVAQSPERREQDQVEAGLKLESDKPTDWLNYYFEELLPDRFLAD